MKYLYENDYDVYLDDLKKVNKTDDPMVSPEIDLVFVLSGRGSVLKNNIDKMSREFDLEDDYLRMMHGISIADRINAARAGKHVSELTDEDRVIPIFYNGRKQHNIDLKVALKNGVLPYPKRLFIIKPINPENTIGQAMCFKAYLENNPHQLVAVVSSGFHLARAGRTFGKESPLALLADQMPNALQQVAFIFYGIDREYKRPGIQYDIPGEHDAMKNYASGFKGTKTPSISHYQSRNTFFCNMDILLSKSFNFALEAPTLQEGENEENNDKKLTI